MSKIRNTSPVDLKSLWVSPLGRRVLAHEDDLLQPLLRRMHGESVVWIGEQSTMPGALSQCMVRLPVFATRSADLKSQELGAVACIQATCQQLPFAAGSLDGVVLHHALETYADPRACIREVERVLKPGGRVIICSFNPFSLTGLRAWFARKATHPLRGRRLISPIRLLDWLALLNLNVDEPPLYKNLSAPMLGDFARRHGLPLLGTPNRQFARAGNYLHQGWRRVAPFLLPLYRRLPIGGLLVLSAFKVAQGSTLIGRSRRTTARKAKLVLTPTVQSPHDG